MLLAHIVDYNVCKIYFVSFTYKENIIVDTTPFHEIDKKQISVNITPYNAFLKCIDIG